MISRVSLLGVPSSAGTHGPGLELAPGHLREAGLVTRLTERGVDVVDHGDLPEVRFRADPAGRTRQNLDLVVDVATQVAARVEALLDDDAVPIVLGGDCTITLGVVAGFLRRGRDLGLLYFDGDIDLSTPERTVSGILDTMGMAHLLGAGARELSRIGPRFPLMPVDRVVAFGYDLVELDEHALAAQRRLGLVGYPANGLADPEASAAEAWQLLAGRATGGVLLHFDVDVIDSTDLPLADFPHFNEGLSLPVALSCLRVFGRQEGLAGLVVTEVNPHRDPDGTLADTLVGGIVDALTQ